MRAALRRASCRWSKLLLATGLAGLLGAPATAHAGGPEPPAEKRDTYSPYEQQTLDRALRQLHAAVEAHPEGKILEGVDVVTLDVFEDRDPMPSVLTPIANWFHKTTRRSVVAREVLLAPGEAWDQALVDQTGRNLRGLDPLSLVICVPLRGGAPDRVRLLVITKDVWSLRLGNDFRYANGRLQYLLLQPSEINLLGTHQVVSATFVMDPATLQFSGSYTLPRIADSRISAGISAGAILNRDTGQVEGAVGSFSYGQPLYSTRAEWAWGANLSLDQGVYRRFVAGLPTDFDPTSGQCAISTVGTAASLTPGRCAYKKDVVTGSFTVTRSFGRALKNDLTLGVFASRKEYRTFDLSSLSPDAQVAFRQAFVPVSDQQVGPYLEWHAYSSVYFDVLDVDTLGLTENYRKGHEITVRVKPIVKALASSRTFVDVYAAASYTLPLGDGYVHGGFSVDNELTTSNIPDGSVSLSLRIVTPRFRHGRLIFDATMLDRYANYLNTKNTLGGDGRLRGYPTAAYLGANYVVANLEYRSDPIEIKAVQLGFALFGDTGDAFDDWKKMRLKQSAGMGLRLVFPQLQRAALRIDLAFPLTYDVLTPSTPKQDLVVTYSQGF